MNQDVQVGQEIFFTCKNKSQSTDQTRKFRVEVPVANLIEKVNEKPPFGHILEADGFWRQMDRVGSESIEWSANYSR